MTTATEAAAVAQKQFGLMQALEEGGFVSWAIFTVLVIMSAVSWYIMFTKLVEQGKVLKQSREGVQKFWTSSSIKDGANKFEKNTAFRQLVDDALLAEDQHGKLIDAQDQHEWMHSSMQRSQDAVNAKLGTGLAFLATVGSTSPFVGLLGTVIGIYRALIKIGASGDASIDKVAGPVGEALIMTAIGLVVAVPAVMGYNWLQRRNKLIAERMNTFCNDLHGYMMSNGAVRPSVKAAAPAAAAKPAGAKA
ncbi:MAG: MotA/TolQ/ExbB proton channel family protein [Alphaproteobacteria bacterium]|jgi:biopolymer transport protein ExbB|nr:MotA/TolQ/ExbB proton channel family protein [Alphaproteobacteria bacterium]